MRKLTFAALAVLAMAIPSAAKAGFIVEASLGKGAQVSPSIDKRLGPTNLLIAPGYGLGEMLRVELGLVMDLPQDSSEYNLRLRPMLVLDPPLLPVYGRLILGIADLRHERTIEYGGAIGVGGSLLGLGVFAETALVPQAADPEMRWLVEGRAGAFYAF